MLRQPQSRRNALEALDETCSHSQVHTFDSAFVPYCSIALTRTHKPRTIPTFQNSTVQTQPVPKQEPTCLGQWLVVLCPCSFVLSLRLEQGVYIGTPVIVNRP